MTIRELEQIGDNWVARTFRLWAVVFDESETAERQEKALRLCGIMTSRVIRLGVILSEARVKNAPKFPPGGIVTKGGNSPYVEQSEFVIPRK